MILSIQENPYFHMINTISESLMYLCHRSDYTESTLQQVFNAMIK